MSSIVLLARRIVSSFSIRGNYKYVYIAYVQLATEIAIVVATARVLTESQAYVVVPNPRAAPKRSRDVEDLVN